MAAETNGANGAAAAAESVAVAIDGTTEKPLPEVKKSWR